MNDFGSPFYVKYCNDLSMAIDLDSTLSQAEVLFLSFSQLVQDMDKKLQASPDDVVNLRNRKQAAGSSEGRLPMIISENLRELLNNHFFLK